MFAKKKTRSREDGRGVGGKGEKTGRLEGTDMKKMTKGKGQNTEKRNVEWGKAHFVGP